MHMVKDTWKPDKAGSTGRRQRGGSYDQRRLPEDTDFWDEFCLLLPWHSVVIGTQ